MEQEDGIRDLTGRERKRKSTVSQASGNIGPE